MNERKFKEAGDAIRQAQDKMTEARAEQDSGAAEMCAAYNRENAAHTMFVHRTWRGHVAVTVVDNTAMLRQGVPLPPKHPSDDLPF